MRQPGERRICRPATKFAARAALLLGMCGAPGLPCAQALPDLGATPGTLRPEELMPAEVAQYANRKWMWSLADFARERHPKQQQLKDSEQKKPAAGWMLYGRVGALRWQNDFGDEELSAFRFGLRHTPPRLPGHAYIGIYRRF